jgi:hypothetical protein
MKERMVVHKLGKENLQFFNSKKEMKIAAVNHQPLEYSVRNCVITKALSSYLFLLVLNASFTKFPMRIL